MADGTSPLAAEAAVALPDGAVVFALADERYAIPIGAVEGIAAPPALSRVPHAAAGLLGAGNLGGQVLPIIDFAALARDFPSSRRYDGSGEILRLRAAGGDVGLWIDRVERFVPAGTALAEQVGVIDPEPLIRLGLTAPSLADEARYPLGDVGEIAERTTEASQAAFFLVEVAGERVQLPYDAVLEFTEPPPWVPVPGAPAGFRGIAMLRGDALPMVSLASLRGARETEEPTTYAVVALASGHRMLLGCDRVIGLRTGEDGRVVDPRTAIPKALRRIVTGFATDMAAQADTADASDDVSFLSFVIGGQSYALPVGAVERVVPPQRQVALPMLPGSPETIASAIELKGQIVPVAQLGIVGSEAEEAPAVYVILRGKSGVMALGAERVDRLVTLRPEQIVSPPGRDALIDGVAIPDDGGDVLRLLAPDRVGSAG